MKALHISIFKLLGMQKVKRLQFCLNLWRTRVLIRTTIFTRKEVEGVIDIISLLHFRMVHKKVAIPRYNNLWKSWNSGQLKLQLSLFSFADHIQILFRSSNERFSDLSVHNGFPKDCAMEVILWCWVSLNLLRSPNELNWSENPFPFRTYGFFPPPPPATYYMNQRKSSALLFMCP